MRIVTEHIGEGLGNRYYVIQEPINETGVCFQFSTRVEAETFIAKNKGGSKMSKIFFGGSVYEVSTKAEAQAAMETISRQVRGTFEGCTNLETGYYVDQDHPINIGGKSLYPILGAMDGDRYGETDDKDLFTR